MRRISGLTRDLAKQARQRAADILSRLETMKKMPGGPELLALSKTVKMEVCTDISNSRVSRVV